jgi:hypothetical protein
MPASVSCWRAGVEHRVQQGAVDRVLAEHRADNDLLTGDDQLGVVAGDVALLVAHHPHLWIGEIR